MWTYLNAEDLTDIYTGNQVHTLIKLVVIHLEFSNVTALSLGS